MHPSWMAVRLQTVYFVSNALPLHDIYDSSLIATRGFAIKHNELTSVYTYKFFQRSVIHHSFIKMPNLHTYPFRHI